MSYVTLSLALAIVFIVYKWWKNYNTNRGLPPGPTGIPFLGYFPFIGKSPQLTLTELGKKYGGIFTVNMGMKPNVVITDWKIMKEALLKQSEIFSGRPYIFSFSMLSNRADIAGADGPVWKEHRRFTLHHLRDFGIGKTSLESIIIDKVEELIDHVDANINNNLEISELTFLPVLSIIWAITAGKSFKVNDKYMLSFAEILKVTMDLMANSNLLNIFPWTRFLPGSNYKQHLKNHLTMSEVFNKEIKEHYESFSEGEPRDLIDVFIAEIKKRKEETGAIGPFDDAHLFGTLYNMFIGGSETVTTGTGWGLLYMAVWPEIQEKVQKEIDTVIGRNRRPTYSDRLHLPYVEATIMEIQRYSSIGGLSAPHCPIKDTELFGYKIPKGTTVIQNIWAVHFDPKLWGDPQIFRPDRFLDEAGKIVKPEYYIPFSLGARFCLGEPLARMELFMFFTNLLQRFSFHCKTGEAPPSLEPIAAATFHPQQFHLRIERR